MMVMQRQASSRRKEATVGAHRDTKPQIDRATLVVVQAAEDAVERGVVGDRFLTDLTRVRLQRERDAGYRLRLARAYLRLLGVEGLPTAIEWVSGADPMLREAAYDALHDLREQALPALLDLVQHRNPDVRWCAYEVAEHLHRPSMVPVLVRGLWDQEAANRWAASNGLIRLGQAALIPTLTALVTEPGSVTFHGAARRVLARLEVAGHEDLRARLLDSLGRGTTVVQSGPIAAALLAALRREANGAAQVARPATRPGTTTPGMPSSPTQGDEMANTSMRGQQPATVRMAVGADAAAVQRLWQDCGLSTASPEEWDALLDGEMGAVFIAEHGDEVVGSAVATFDGWRAYVYHVAVAPQVRGQGLASALMAEAEQYLMAAGARNVYAAVDEEHTEALAFAVVNGYLPEGERVLVKTLDAVSAPLATTAVGG